MKNYFNWKPLAALIAAFFLQSCQKEEFGAERPYAVQVSKQRNFQDALSIKGYLSDIGLAPYIICHRTEEEETWFRVLIGADESLEDMRIKKMGFEDDYLFSKAELVNYNALEPGMLNCKEDEFKENELSASKPDVPEAVHDVTDKFPVVHNFFIKNLELFSSLKSQEIAKFKQAGASKLDLPRGIAPFDVLANTDCFAEAVYADYLNGQSLTLDVMKMKPGHRFGEDLPGFFADKIVGNKGGAEYERDKVEVGGKLDWRGFKITMASKEGKGNYLVLTDPDSSYLVFCQSQNLEMKQLVYFLGEDSRGDGLKGYNEYFNTFYTLPFGNGYGDTLVYFHLEKLEENPGGKPASKAWAKNYAGNWLSKAHFYNKEEGLWKYSLYNLASDGHGKQVFDQRFGGKNGLSRKDSIELFENTLGYYTYETRRDPKTNKNTRFPEDLSFAVNRYIATLTNAGSSWLDERGLSKRAKIFQFNLEAAEED